MFYSLYSNFSFLFFFFYFFSKLPECDVVGFQTPRLCFSLFFSSFIIIIIIFLIVIIIIIIIFIIVINIFLVMNHKSLMQENMNSRTKR